MGEEGLERAIEGENNKDLFFLKRVVRKQLPIILNLVNCLNWINY